MHCSLFSREQGAGERPGNTVNGGREFSWNTGWSSAWCRVTREIQALGGSRSTLFLSTFYPCDSLWLWAMVSSHKSRRVKRVKYDHSSKQTCWSVGYKCSTWREKLGSHAKDTHGCNAEENAVGYVRGQLRRLCQPRGEGQHGTERGAQAREGLGATGPMLSRGRGPLACSPAV